MLFVSASDGRVSKEHGLTVLLSSHSISDLERVCDYLIILSDARVQLAGDIDEIIRSHWQKTRAGPLPGDFRMTDFFLRP